MHAYRLYSTNVVSKVCFNIVGMYSVRLYVLRTIIMVDEMLYMFRTVGYGCMLHLIIIINSYALIGMSTFCIMRNFNLTSWNCTWNGGTHGKYRAPIDQYWMWHFIWCTHAQHHFMLMSRNCIFISNDFAHVDFVPKPINVTINPGEKTVVSPIGANGY